MGSRGIKDLRELVVVSRLTFRDSDSDSDDGRAGLITPFEKLHVVDSGTYNSSGDDLPRNPNNSSEGDLTPTPPSSADSGLGRRKRKKKKPKGYRSIAQPQTEFPRPKPLPSVGQSFTISPTGSAGSSPIQPNLERRDYNDVLNFIDDNIVAEWLQRANHNLKELTLWCTDKNFVHFAQFWITEFGVEKRCEILHLEHSILLDELSLAFKKGFQQKVVTTKDVVDLLAAIFREYPRKLTMSAGVYLFLDYLDVFTSERALEYRKILSDVKLSTQNKQHVQLLLASRSFMLINVWMAIVNFYRCVYPDLQPLSSAEAFSYRDKTEVLYSRLVEAITAGHVEVVHYFLYSGKISAGYTDSRQKTILHIATAANQLRVVEYLLKKWTGCMDVNRACETGNTPLHVSVNLGNLDMVKFLLQIPDIRVNTANSQCNNSTPLHLAVLHGNCDMVKLLLTHKADPTLLMDEQDCLQVAHDFQHDDIHLLLQSYM